ncbi:structural maintenance of chromosomes protein 4-like [Oppia nitens]|uniref:structural maintenance of chromosomes protein 4-like n=1 Tax=Oppia nitens TaxID=1686743 RepID=UPI0023DBDB58|nr:structural maintenance of chromosomes protein 4-like [Oppia nitens]
MKGNKHNQSISKSNGDVGDQQIVDDQELDDEFDDEEGGRRIGDIYIPPPPAKPTYSGEDTGIRLVITNIENINFKSYANRQVLGPFHKSFTSIVGPNGSGKSNVIDSMLFVFGYRAQKLRLKKLSGLIHSSDTYPDLSYCKVIVHFALINDKIGDDFDIISGSEFTVSRTANRDNSSYYCIDDRRVQFKEVSKLLQSHGIDLRYNRFLILQGEVEQIALMKPKADNENESGMLEFLEDIIGTTRLKEPLNQLSLKVEEYNEIRAEKMNRVKVVEKELKTLEDAKNEAIKFLEAENDIMFEKSKLYQMYRHEANNEKDKALSDYNRAKDAYDKAMQECNDLKQQRETSEAEQNHMKEEFSLIVKKCDSLNEKFKECEGRDVQLRGKVKNIKSKGKTLEKTVEEDNKKLEELLKMPDKYKEDIEKLTQKKQTSENDLKLADEHLTEVMGQIKGDTEPLQKRKDVIERELLELQKGVNESRSRMEIAKQELDLYLSAEQNEKSRLQQMMSKLNKNTSDAKDKREALQRFETEIPLAENKLKEFTDNMSKLEHNKSKLTEDYINRNNHLQSLLNSAKDMNSRNRVLNALMEQKRKGKLKGILGRLGDLGAVDAQYDCAVSTACGPLDNIVVETIDNGTECIDFLKKNNIGFAKFMALDKISERLYQIPESEDYPEGVSRLFDLIRVNDERVRVAFYFGLRDTLVAKDLEQAHRISAPKNSNKRYRVVTLKGELCETTGTMSGGGRPFTGRIGSSVAMTQVDEQEIKDLEEEVNQLKNRINETNNRLDDLRIDVERLSKDIKIMKQNKPQFEMEVNQFDKMQTDLKRAIKEQEEKVKMAAPDANRVKELENKHQTEVKKYEKEEQKCSKFNEELEELNDKIKEIMDKKVGTARKKVNELKSQLKKITTDLNKANSDLIASERNIEKCKEKIKSFEEEMNEAINTLTTTKEELKTLEVLATEVTNNYEQAVNEKEEAIKKIKTIENKISKLKTEEAKLNNANVDTKHEVEQQKIKLDEKEAEVNSYTLKINELNPHEIDGKSRPLIPELNSEEIENLNPNSLQKIIENLDKDLKKMKPNMAAIEEYKKKETVFLERAQELSDITSQRDAYKGQYEEVREMRVKEFKDGFLTIARKLKEMYRMITMGGDAELEFIDSLDPFSEGVTFAVRPNKKSWKKISNLSGGEKTLSSLALIFALHYYKPSPLYVMDEIDAALDFKNVSIVANYIKQRTRNTQFIIISLRNNMYELADRLVGIYKTYNCTKTVTINPIIIEEKRSDRRTVTLSSSNTVTNESTNQVINSQQQQQQQIEQNITQDNGNEPIVDNNDNTITDSTHSNDNSVFVN